MIEYLLQNAPLVEHDMGNEKSILHMYATLSFLPLHLSDIFIYFTYFAYLK